MNTDAWSDELKGWQHFHSTRLNNSKIEITMAAAIETFRTTDAKGASSAFRSDIANARASLNQCAPDLPLSVLRRCEEVRFWRCVSNLSEKHSLKTLKATARGARPTRWKKWIKSIQKAVGLSFDCLKSRNFRIERGSHKFKNRLDRDSAQIIGIVRHSSSRKRSHILG